MIIPQAVQTSILLVDDDASILEAVSDVLQYHGYRVLTARDGQEALALMQDFLPDVIISDIAMPRMDGHQFFDAVRQRPSWMPIPFIFLSARGQQADIRQGYTLGVDDYITKPFEVGDLVLKVESRLKRVREIQAAADNESERLKNQLMTVFGHELRTPLTYIYGYTSLLREEHENLDEATLDQMLGGVQIGAERLMRLIEDLMLMLRLDNGIMDVEVRRRRASVSVREIVDQVVTVLQPGASPRSVLFDVQVDPGLRVSGLALYLENALTRLIDNGIRYAKTGGGTITIATETRAQTAVIRVSDDGIGIDAVDQKRVFERFSQIDRETLEQQGIGLGLAVARGIVRAHGGDITLSSKPGAGSTFEVTLPLAN